MKKLAAVVLVAILGLTVTTPAASARDTGWDLRVTSK